jgi:hypothetical protein
MNKTPEKWARHAAKHLERGQHVNFTLQVAATLNASEGQARRIALPPASPTAQSLNPDWVESLMGFPPKWTDGLPVPEKPRKIGKRRESATPAKEPRAVSVKPASKPSATRSSRKSRAKSGDG